VQFAASLFTVLGKEQEQATGKRFDAEDLAVGMIQFANGLTLQLEMGFGSHIEKELLYFELYGDRGGASTRDGLKLFSAPSGVPLVSVPARELPRPAIPTVPDDFIAAIREQRPPAVSPESGVAVTRILEGLRRSAEQGWGTNKE
jgi:predicted dehydrogenase